MAATDDQEPHVPPDLPLPTMRLASDRMGAAYGAVAQRPTDPEGQTHPGPPEIQEERPRTHLSARSERGAELAVALCFTLSFLATVLFCCAYVLVDLHGDDLGQLQNLLLGTGVGVGFLGVSLGLGMWAKLLTPRVMHVQHRPEHHSPEEHEIAAETQVLGGAVEAGVPSRKLLRRTLLLAVGALPIPFVFGLRDMGPRLGNRLRVNAWRKDVRLVDLDTGEPVKLGDIEPGGYKTVMPEGATDATKPVNAESAVNLIHLPPGTNHPIRGRETWTAADHIAYSRICTHAGCPVGLFEHRELLLLCPCHQSTFDVTRGCQVVFGPAPRALPQLPIYVDDQGYFRAQRGFDVALGPSFWERDVHGFTPQ